MLHQYLSNGVEVLVKENHFAKMVTVQVWVGVGSLFETEDERGLSHLIEHMLFKGTARRAVGEISKTVEACGGDINAYTTFDRTVFYLTMSSKHWRTGVDLLADAVLNSAFDPEELAREKEVVLEEIRRGNDDPASLIGRRVFHHIYKGNEAGRPIIGSTEEVSRYERADVVRFFKKWYQPDNFTVVVVGDFDSAEMLPWVEQCFGQASGRAPAKPAVPERHSPKDIVVELIKGDYQLPRLEMGFAAPELEHADTIGLDLATFALGSGDASRLNRVMRDRDGVVSSVGCSLYSPRFGGLFELSAYPTEDSYLEAVAALARETVRMKYHEPITELELARARANLKADRVYQEETVTGQARALGFGLTTSHGPYYDDVYAALVNNMTIGSVVKAVNCWVKEEEVVVVGLLPESSSITEADVRAAYERGVAEGKAAAKETAVLAAATTEEQFLAPVVTELLPGVKLVYRQNLSSGLFNLVAAAEGGLRGETDDTAGLYNAIADMLGTATTSLPYEQLLAITEGIGASLQGFSGKDSFGLKLQCLAEHAEALTHIWADCFLHPVFPAEQWETVKREILESIRAEQDSPANIAIRALQEQLFPGHPYRRPIYGSKEAVEAFKPVGIQESFEALRDAGDWVIGCVTELPLEEVQTILREALGPWHPKPGRRKFAATPEKAGGREPLVTKIKKDREQTHIVIGYRGLTWDDPDRGPLDVLATILGGTGGRLFLKLRDQQSLAYTVSPLMTYGCHPGVIGAYIACAPEKTAQARNALVAELELLCHELADQEEVDRAINYLVGGHEADNQRSDSQATTMALMEAYDIGHDDFLKYPARIEAVRREDVMRVARRLIGEGRLIEVTVGP